MIDSLWPGGPRFKGQTGVFRLGTDSVMLAHFAKGLNMRKCPLAADLGCGSGIISVILAWENPLLRIDGIEIQPEAAQLAIENAKLCGVSDRLRIIEGDLRKHRSLLKSGAYDLTVSNPPYYTIGSGKLPSATGLATARSEENCTLEDVCDAAGYLTRWGGSFMLVHKPERLACIFRSLNSAGFEPK
ncbi:MAG: methyltransferase, partial [Oscillospiraceae bacterium]|nr:methyltransferase [Oscillospiraceae bacterium]